MNFALVNAEDLGVTTANLEQSKQSKSPEILRLPGRGRFWQGARARCRLGSDCDRRGGNYGEIWDRNQKPLAVQRGVNKLWRDGGLQYAPPFR